MGTPSGPGYYPNGNPIVVGGSLPLPQPTSDSQRSTTPGGDSNTHPHYQGKTAPGGGPVAMSPKQVRSMQQFLINHGFAVTADGVLGPQTKAASAAFRANHKGGAQWSAKYGIGVHPGVVPHGNPADPATAPPAGGGAPPAAGGVDAGGAFQVLLKQLLAQGGNVGTPFNAAALGNAAAAPDDALATTLTRQAAQNPVQETQNQADISSWYGLDPKDPSYKLSVLGRLAQAKAGNAAAASATSGNDASLAAQLASSIGGSANDGSASVAAAGANAAGTAAALGQESQDYANNMNPLLAAEATGAQSKEKASNAQALLALQDQLAQAKGAATADRATGAAGAQDKNNALGQQRFANRGNLLSTLAQMAAVDPNANMLKDTLTQAKINQTNAKTNQIVSGKTSTGKIYKIDLGKATTTVGNLMGLTGTTVPTNQHLRLAQAIGGVLRSQGFKPGDGEFKRLGDQIFGTFVDEHGRPLQSPGTWQI